MCGLFESQVADGSVAVSLLLVTEVVTSSEPKTGSLWLK
jgi:hypothetical protein